MKRNPTRKNSDYNLSFWFVALWPLICVAIVVIGFLAADVIKTL
jgi:nitrate reductase NapE component